MAKTISVNTTDGLHGWIFAEVVYDYDVTKYRSIPVSRYFLTRCIIVGRFLIQLIPTVNSSHSQLVNSQLVTIQ